MRGQNVFKGTLGGREGDSDLHSSFLLAHATRSMIGHVWRYRVSILGLVAVDWCENFVNFIGIGSQMLSWKVISCWINIRNGLEVLEIARVIRAGSAYCFMAIIMGFVY